MPEADLIYGGYDFHERDPNESLLEIGGTGHSRINEPIRTEQLNAPGAPTSPGGGSWDVSRLQDWMRGQGISDHVIGEEANQGFLDRRAAEGNLDATLQTSLPRWLERSHRPTASAGGVGGDADPFELGAMNPNVLAAITRAQQGQASRSPFGMVGNQFTDPYTSLFEDVAKRQLQRLEGSNAQMDRFNAYLDQEFARLSQSQGYTPEEQAVLRTQALEPIERDRAALNRRVTERTAARGFLPSSGLHELGLRDVDREAEERRTVAQRDLAINAITKGAADRSRALDLARLGVDLPIQHGTQALSVANQLYQLPRNAMMDSLQVLNASSPQSAIGSQMELLRMQQEQGRYNDQQDQALLEQIGEALYRTFIRR